MKVFTRILGLIALAYAVGFFAVYSTPAAAQAIDRMTAPQLLVLLRENITALQETTDGIVPIGRGVVEGGAATLPYMTTPIAGVPIIFSASKDNHISSRLRVSLRQR